jgi:hypothetical protein
MANKAVPQAMYLAGFSHPPSEAPEPAKKQ